MGIKTIARQIGYRNLPVYYLEKLAFKHPYSRQAFNKIADSVGTAAKALIGGSYRYGIIRNCIEPKSIIAENPIVAEIPYGKIKFDDLTKSLIEKIGTYSSDISLTGLLNFSTGQVHLMENGSHIELAHKWRLRANVAKSDIPKEEVSKIKQILEENISSECFEFKEGVDGFDVVELIFNNINERTREDLLQACKKLKDNWYGFRIYCLPSAELKITPVSGSFGEIPIEYSSIFEDYIKALFGNKTNKILFLQLDYKRNIPYDTLNSIRSKHEDMLLAPKSLSDNELLKLLNS